MGKYLNIGNAGFKSMTKDIYVDKTGMIGFINSTLGTTRKLTCVSRPRRFGKSFAAKMLCAYYDKSCDSRGLFEGLDISKDDSFERFLNKYDVIYLDITLFIFREYTMLSPGNLAKYMGFTESEVMGLCEKYDADFEMMKFWYDGYLFRHLKSVYSPNSVIEAIERNEFGSYWARTETYESLKVYIDLNEDGLKEAIVQMLGGERVIVDVETFQNDMTNIRRKDDVLTLLIHLGYLAYDAEKKHVFIPNEEVKQEFVRAVTTGKHVEIAKLIQNSDHLLKQTLNMDEEAVAEAIEKAHKASAAPISYNNEEALRSTIRIAYISCLDEYTVIDELPSGHGYADIAFVPKRALSLPVILIELKWNKTDTGAIRQIKEKDYPQVFNDFGGEILLVGINYDAKSKKHTCKIEKYMG